jgi:hypothetical protein
VSDERPAPKPGPAPWGAPVGIMVGLVLFALLKDVPLWARIVIAFAAIAVMTWVSIQVARRRR